MTIHQLSLHGLPTTWAALLNRARSEADVVRVVREFVAQLTPQELAALPEALRPGRFRDAQDIADFAVAVKMHYLSPHEVGEEPGLEARIAAFFAGAAHRAAQLSQITESEEDKSA